jgi:hypothetical protein
MEILPVRLKAWLVAALSAGKAGVARQFQPIFNLACCRPF